MGSLILTEAVLGNSRQIVTDKEAIFELKTSKTIAPNEISNTGADNMEYLQFLSERLFHRTANLCIN